MRPEHTPPEPRHLAAPPRGAPGRVGRLALGVLLCALAPRAEAFTSIIGDGSRWTSAPSFSILSFPRDLEEATVRQAVIDAFASWEQVAGVNLPMREVASGGDITLDFLYDWPPEFGEFTLGITQPEIYRDETIRGARISFNMQNYQWAIPSRDERRIDLQGVATHEIGHALGLGHSFMRAATMYWSGSSSALSSLDVDDARGLRFLYGGRGEGLACDTCTQHDDCAEGGYCVLLDEDQNLAFCGQPCGPECPPNSACYNLDGGAQNCFGENAVCSDDQDANFAAGDYCFGADQCPADAPCLIEDDDARCTEGGTVGFGEDCQADFLCESQLCLPLGDATAACSEACDPDNPDCPHNVECFPLDGVDGLEGVCIPTGDVDPGGACDRLVNRCIGSALCVDEDHDAFCRARCAPFGRCASGHTCTPTDASASDETPWVCLPDSELEPGAQCPRTGCGGGLVCAPRSAGTRCYEICELGTTCDGGAPCRHISGELGLCPFGTREFRGDCVGWWDCLSGACLETEARRLCSEFCQSDDDCPQNWACEANAEGVMMCHQLPEPEDAALPPPPVDAAPPPPPVDAGIPIDAAVIVDAWQPPVLDAAPVAGGGGASPPAGGWGTPLDAALAPDASGQSEDDELNGGFCQGVPGGPVSWPLPLLLMGLLLRRRTQEMKR